MENCAHLPSEIKTALVALEIVKRKIKKAQVRRTAYGCLSKRFIQRVALPQTSFFLTERSFSIGPPRFCSILARVRFKPPVVFALFTHGRAHQAELELETGSTFVRAVILVVPGEGQVAEDYLDELVGLGGDAPVTVDGDAIVVFVRLVHVQAWKGTSTHLY